MLNNLRRSKFTTDREFLDHINTLINSHDSNTLKQNAEVLLDILEFSGINKNDDLFFKQIIMIKFFKKIDDFNSANYLIEFVLNRLLSFSNNINEVYEFFIQSIDVVLKNYNLYLMHSLIKYIFFFKFKYFYRNFFINREQEINLYVKKFFKFKRAIINYYIYRTYIIFLYFLKKFLFKFFDHRNILVIEGHIFRFSSKIFRKFLLGSINNTELHISRNIGGLGDIFMMIFAIDFLRTRISSNIRIKFFIPDKYLPIFKSSEKINFYSCSHELSEKIDLFNLCSLSHCPAGFVESSTYPKIVDNRIEIFAQQIALDFNLDISPIDIERGLTSHNFDLSEYLNSFSNEDIFDDDRKTVCIAPFSADSYKSITNLIDVVYNLPNDLKFVILHNFSPFDVLIKKDISNVVYFESNDLLKYIPYILKSELVISVDTSWFHIASMLNKPTIGIFGPTDGLVFSKFYKNVCLYELKNQFSCSPCWRNENMNCRLTSNKISACLKNIDLKALSLLIKDFLFIKIDA